VTDAQVRELLMRLFDDEPAPGDTVTSVYRRAERLRRRRQWRAIAAGACLVVLVALAGYGVTDALFPRVGGDLAGGPGDPTSSVPAPPTVDRVGAAIGRNLASSGLTFRPDARGTGWRRYTVFAAATSVGTLDVVVYPAAVALCYPKAAGTSDCARDRTTDDGLEYATYTEDDSAEQQYTEILARQPAEGRGVAAYAAGPRASGERGPGESPLGIGLLQRVALDRSVIAAFDADEWCGRPSDPACPTPAVPMPPDGAV
jgi:hypothetical protein